MSLSFLVTSFPTTTNAYFKGQSLKAPPSFTPTSIPKRSSYTSCKGNHQDQENVTVNDEGKGIDRRSVLVGLGGLYGATATFGKLSVANPVQDHDLTKCHFSQDPHLAKGSYCCAPHSLISDLSNIKAFKPPGSSEKPRVRKSIENLSDQELKDFNKAVRMMKELEPNDPWSYMQQSQIHCAYCLGAYGQKDFQDAPLQIHGSWLFLAWHRYYIYFWERILAKLIEKDDFSIPYWEWDSPSGMKIPSQYKETVHNLEYLYNPNRNQDHLTALINYKFHFTEPDPINNPNPAPFPNPTSEEEPEVILANQKELLDIFTNNLAQPKNFLGSSIREGQVRHAPGALERIHGVPHLWVGLPDPPRWDMGNFHSAARDTMFYGHHANVDRLWSIYTEQREGKPDFKSNARLEASFVFYDENRSLVRCKVKDCIDTSNLNYKYENMNPEWLHIRESYISNRNAKLMRAAQKEMSAVDAFGTLPRLLNTTIRALVPRPPRSISRSENEKIQAAEVIVVDGFQLEDGTNHARFDVYIAKPTEGLVTSDLGEYAGGYVYIPHSIGQATHTGELHLGITRIVEDIDANESEQLVVSFVPRGGVFTIPGVSIELVPNEDDSAECWNSSFNISNYLCELG